MQAKGNGRKTTSIEGPQSKPGGSKTAGFPASYPLQIDNDKNWKGMKKKAVKNGKTYFMYLNWCQI